MKTSRYTSISAVCLVTALAALTGCGSSDHDHSSASGSASASSGASSNGTAAEEGLKVEQAWAKAADQGMTAVFGTVTNTSDHEITVTSASTEASSKVQLHETVADHKTGATSMQEKKGGFTLKPGESLKLQPGGNHIMLMNLRCSLLAGNSIGVTLKTKDGTSLDFDAPVRDYTGAKENYDPSEGNADSGHEHSTGEHSGHEHSGHEDSMHDHSMGEHSGHGMDSMTMPSSGSSGASSSALPSCKG